MSEPTRLILVRHGETAANREFRYIGARDDELTERGHEQAAAVAAALHILPVAAIFASPRRRTLATAQPLAAALGLAVEQSDALRENAFGAWEGMSRAEVLERSAEDAALLKQWEQDASVAPPEGESLEAMRDRVVAWAGELCASRPGQTVVLVSHVGPIKALIAATLGVPTETARAMFLDPATVSVADWGSRRVLRLFNSHAHLGWDQARWITNS